MSPDIPHTPFAFINRSHSASTHVKPAVDVQGFAGDVPCRVGRQVDHRSGDIFAWVFFALSVIYLIYEFNPATMQWNIGG